MVRPRLPSASGETEPVTTTVSRTSVDAGAGGWGACARAGDAPAPSRPATTARRAEVHSALVIAGVMLPCRDMRAIRVTAFGGPDVLTLAEVPDPQPGPGQVRVRVHAAGVNPVETYIRSGTYASKPALPYTPGSDARRRRRRARRGRHAAAPSAIASTPPGR